MEKFDKFEKLDRQIEQTIHEVENMNRHDFFEKFIHNSFMFAAVWACFLNLIIETLGRYSTVGIWGGGFLNEHKHIHRHIYAFAFYAQIVVS